jgi:hypothetical protein
MKKFFKSLPVIVIALVALSGLAIAGLLSYYGKVVGTATVQQSVRLVNPDTNQDYQCTGGNYDSCKYDWRIGDIVAGSSGYKIFTLKNYAPSAASISFEVSVTPQGGVTAEVTGVSTNGGTTTCEGNAPNTVPAAGSDGSPGVAQFCVKYTSDLTATPETYTITVGIKTSTS